MLETADKQYEVKRCPVCEEKHLIPKGTVIARTPNGIVSGDCLKKYILYALIELADKTTNYGTSLSSSEELDETLNNLSNVRDILSNTNLNGLFISLLIGRTISTTMMGSDKMLSVVTLLTLARDMLIEIKQNKEDFYTVVENDDDEEENDDEENDYSWD